MKPCAKMEVINSFGSKVQQGGSRSFAIYAPLNWQHGDTLDFLRAEYYYKMPVGATCKGLWDTKH